MPKGSAASTRLDTDDPFMSVNEVAAFLGVHRANVYRMMAEGRLPYIVVGSGARRRVRQSDVKLLIDTCAPTG